jgi:hypothetical protein
VTQKCLGFHQYYISTSSEDHYFLPNYAVSIVWCLQSKIKIHKSLKCYVDLIIFTVSPAAMTMSLKILTIISFDSFCSFIFFNNPFSEQFISLLKIEIKLSAVKNKMIS